MEVLVRLQLFYSNSCYNLITLGVDEENNNCFGAGVREFIKFAEQWYGRQVIKVNGEKEITQGLYTEDIKEL
jgi:hypothetical protein